MRIVKFGATWCGPCSAQGGILRDLKEQFDNIDVEEVDIDESPELAVEFKIKALPTLIAYKSDVEIARVTGLHTKQQLVKLLNL